MTQLGTKKSRRGCTNCKRRRVKCNEESPCANCIRRAEACSLEAPSPSNASQPQERSDDLPATTEEWLEDMALMKHCSTHLIYAQPISMRDTIKRLWADIIPDYALRHTFLLHGLLSLAAMSIAFDRPAESARYMSMADRHQAIALSGFRTALAAEMTLDLSGALFAHAFTISISSMARSCAVAAAQLPRKAVGTDEIAELFFLTRGVRDVIDVARDFISKTLMSDMFWGHAMPESEESFIRLPQEMQSRMDELQAMLNEHCGSEPEVLVRCSAALKDLSEIYRNIMYFKRTEVDTAHLAMDGTSSF